MAISYHVYANDGQGGAIDYSNRGRDGPGPLGDPSRFVHDRAAGCAQ